MKWKLSTFDVSVLKELLAAATAADVDRVACGAAPEGGYFDRVLLWIKKRKKQEHALHVQTLIIYLTERRTAMETRCR